ncbi:MAG: hypothetical protein D6744_16880 [Planctomycetota bacterium]|nr:MAG: hypothetical protein D6744_16880 [Planctomycetota bacterium]
MTGRACLTGKVACDAPEFARKHIRQDGDALDRRVVLGCMTGTSIDAIDVARVTIRGNGLEMRAEVQQCASRPLGELGDELRRLAGQQPFSAAAIARLARRFSDAHIDALRLVADGRPPDLICVHGQTVYHDPPDSWQLIGPARIAHALAAPVVFDLRAADLAAGGRGAPITPLADAVLFRETAPAVIVNFGGFCNFAMLPAWSENGRIEPRRIVGGDLCVCNHLLDGVARSCWGRAYDEGGARAAKGAVVGDVFDELVATLTQQRCARRSLGTGDELQDWVARYAGRLRGEDLARTACAAIAETIASADLATRSAEADPACASWLVAGGGALNATLLDELRRRVSGPVATSDARSVPATHREAVAMAVLGALCQDGVPITLPQVTGVPEPAPVAGAWVGVRSR